LDLASLETDQKVPLMEHSKTGLLVLSLLVLSLLVLSLLVLSLLVLSLLAGGLLSGKFSRENQKPENSRRSSFDFPLVDKERVWKILEVIKPIAKEQGCTQARIALAWLLAKPVVTSAIIGAKNITQLELRKTA